MNLKVYTQLYCKEALKNLDNYLDRELAAEDIRLIEKHLAVCKHCAAKFKYEAEVVDELKSKVRRISAPAELKNKIMTAISDTPPET